MQHVGPPDVEVRPGSGETCPMRSADEWCPPEVKESELEREMLGTVANLEITAVESVSNLGQMDGDGYLGGEVCLFSCLTTVGKDKVKDIWQRPLFFPTFSYPKPRLPWYLRSSLESAFATELLAEVPKILSCLRVPSGHLAMLLAMSRQ